MQSADLILVHGAPSPTFEDALPTREARDAHLQHMELLRSLNSLVTGWMRTAFPQTILGYFFSGCYYTG